MDIGKAIKTLRVSRGLTQKQLADRVGCSETNMIFMETGRSFPRMEKIESICRELNIPQAYLLVFALTKEDIPEGKQGVYETRVQPLRDELLSDLVE